MLEIERLANFAGCVTTRKSTTGTAIMLGKHCVKFNSWTQGVIALSVGEAEFYALVKTASRAVGMEAMSHDLGREKSRPLFNTDSQSSIGTCSRRGAGKLRHLETPLLGLQHVISKRQLSIAKVSIEYARSH